MKYLATNGTKKFFFLLLIGYYFRVGDEVSDMALIMLEKLF